MKGISIACAAPKILEKSKDEKFLECEGDSFTGWGLFVTKLKNDNGIIFKLTATTQKGQQRVVALPVIDVGKNRDSNFVYGPAQPRTIFGGIKIRSGKL